MEDVLRDSASGGGTIDTHEKELADGASSGTTGPCDPTAPAMLGRYTERTTDRDRGYLIEFSTLSSDAADALLESRKVID